MKPDIHPKYHPVVFRDISTGDEIITRPLAPHKPFGRAQISTEQDPSIDHGMMDVNRRLEPIRGPTKTATFSAFDNVDEPVIDGFQRAQH